MQIFLLELILLGFGLLKIYRRRKCYSGYCTSCSVGYMVGIYFLSDSGDYYLGLLYKSHVAYT